MASKTETAPLGSALLAVSELWGAVGGVGEDFVGGAEAEGEVERALDAGAVGDGVVDVAVGYVLELVADLGDGHVLAGEEAVEDGIGGAGIFAVGAGAFVQRVRSVGSAVGLSLGLTATRV
jgi:hypothetical protein